MGLTNKLKTYKAGLVFLLFILFFSCEDIEKYFVNCTDCTDIEPTEADLKIRLDSKFGHTVINIYEGLLEDSVLFDSYTTTTDETSARVPINKTYTLTARYYNNQKYYYAVNSVTPRVVYEKDKCENPCYFVYDRVVDLRLKYIK
jgi:hypothetical protein